MKEACQGVEDDEDGQKIVRGLMHWLDLASRQSLHRPADVTRPGWLYASLELECSALQVYKARYKSVFWLLLSTKKQCLTAE